MMKLITMKALVETLDDKWQSPIAEEILSCWRHDVGSASYVRASANFVFSFQRSGRHCYLRFNRASERACGSIRAELEFINHLSSKGLLVVKPVPSNTGQLVESISTSQGVFHAVVFEGLLGRQAEVEELTPELFVRWGSALGELHRASQGFQITGRQTLQDKLAEASDLLPETEVAAQAVLMELNRKLARLSANERSYGLIHCDFELDNLFWDGERVGILDFDDSAYGWFAADIAFALRDLFEDRASGVDLQNESFLCFLKGYRTSRELSQGDLELIPMFLQLHNLLSFARLHRAVGAPAAQAEPEWLESLRAKLILKMQAFRDGFTLN